MAAASRDDGPRARRGPFGRLCCVDGPVAHVHIGLLHVGVGYILYFLIWDRFPSHEFMMRVYLCIHPACIDLRLQINSEPCMPRLTS
jgi:hypothetical protein